MTRVCSFSDAVTVVRVFRKLTLNTRTVIVIGIKCATEVTEPDFTKTINYKMREGLCIQALSFFGQGPR